MERNKERICVEINTLEEIHLSTTFNANKSVRQMTTEMDDSDLLMKMSERDLIAIVA